MRGGDLERAALRIREHVDVSTTAAADSRARSELVRRVAQSSRTRSAPVRLGMLAAAAGLVLASWSARDSIVAAWVRQPESQELTFTVGPGAPGHIGAYVTAEGSSPVLLSFSDGSRVELEGTTRARVTSVGQHGAVMLLETGRARVDVVHRADTDWSFLAGPYRVIVKGTRFEVGFDASSQTIEIRMRSGVVSVEGPGLSRPVEIHGEQRFLHSARPGAGDAPPPPASQAPSAAPSTPAEPAAPLANIPERRAAGPASAVPAPSARAESWSKLGRDGQYRRIVELAETRGLETTLAGASADDLAALASAARFSGRGELAARAYEAIRDRFPGSVSATQAAFYLGRMTESASPSAAVGYYEKYVAEAPGGAFVAEAMGRRMVCLKRAGSTAAALDAAREYIHRFPTGPYAGVAREMMDAAAP